MSRILLHIILIGAVFAQERISINGKVISAEDGGAVIGASVLVAHTTIGTSTDGEGRFLLKSVPPNRIRLQISAVGFKTILYDVSAAVVGETTIRLQPSPIQTQAVVVTANKRPQSLEEIPVSMSILDASSFEQRNSVALDDALRYVPGVNFQQSQINIRASSGYSRGVGSRVSLLIDGVPLLSGDTGEITFESIPVFQIDRVEVVKGAGSTLYGSGALSGVVNVLTKEVEEKPAFFWKVYSGAYSSPAFSQWKWTDSYRMTDGQFARYSSRYNNLGIVVSFNRLSDDGYRESDWLRRYNSFVKLKYDLSPYQSVTVSSNLFYQHRADFLWWKNFQNALRPVDAQKNITVTSLRFNNSVVYKHFVSDEFYYDVKAVHFRGNWFRDSLNNVRLDQSISDAVVVDVQGNWTLNETNFLTFGIAGNYERVRANIFGSHEGRGGAVYLQDEYRFFDDLSAIIGIRHDVQNVIGTYTEQQTTPKLGMRYSIDDANSIRLSIGSGFRAPSIGELYTSTTNTGSAVIVVPNVNLKPEQSWTYEISSTHKILDYMQFDAAIFHSEFSDLIEPTVFLDPVDSLAKIDFKNITQARIQGFEASILTKMFEQSLSLHLHYNYNWAVDRNTKTFLRFRPRHIAGVNTSFDYSFFTIGMDYRFISRIEQVDEQLIDLAPILNGRNRVDIHVVDARIIYNLIELGFPAKISFNVTNMLGYNYNELIGNVSPPRQFVLSLEGMLQ